MFPLLLTIVLIPAFYVLIIRPQQKRQREHLAMVGSLVAGDRVEAFSGIHGTLTAVHDKTVQIEVADGVVLTMARLAIAARLDDDVEADDDVEEQVESTPEAPADVQGTTEGDPR